MNAKEAKALTEERDVAEPYTLADALWYIRAMAATGRFHTTLSGSFPKETVAELSSLGYYVVLQEPDERDERRWFVCWKNA